MKSSLLIFCLAMAVLSVVSGNVVVEPKFQQILHNGNTSVLCTFDNPLEACQVRVSWEKSSWVSVNLTKGGPPVPVSTPDGDILMTVRETGKGLDSKECALELGVVEYGNYLVQCRGRNLEGLWDQGFGLVASDTLNRLVSTTQTPRFVVAEPGSDVSVLLTTDTPLDECAIMTPSAGPLDLPAGEVPPPGSRYVLLPGMKNRQCGFTLTNVSQADAGVWWWMGRRDNEVAWQMTVVAVDAAPVGQPVLTVRPKRLVIGQPLFATCEVPRSVPVSNVTWYLGAKKLTPAPKDDMPDREDRLPWEAQFTKQVLKHVVVPSDIGKYLKCRVTHSDMPDARTSNSVLLKQPLKVV